MTAWFTPITRMMEARWQPGTMSVQPEWWRIGRSSANRWQSLAVPVTGFVGMWQTGGGGIIAATVIDTHKGNGLLLLLPLTTALRIIFTDKEECFSIYKCLVLL